MGRHATTPIELEALLTRDPLEAARKARLRYVDDTMPGIRREMKRGKPRYLDVDGAVIDDVKELDRIRGLVIPPAWIDVWICPIANGHLQATGRDARGRKQYRYHTRWRKVRDETKYHRMILFGEALPRIRGQADKDSRLPGLTREKVLGTIVQLLERTLIRIGNEEYARENGSFGLTTMRDRHVMIEGSHLEFRFKGKSGVRHDIEITDRRLAQIVRKCRDIPGYELFQYVDENGEYHSIDSDDVNSYISEIASEDFTAKDFRTWGGTVLAAEKLMECPECTSDDEAKLIITETVKSVASCLGNTPTVCRKCYIHPTVLDAYKSAKLAEVMKRKRKRGKSVNSYALRPSEEAVLVLLRSQIADGE